MKIRAPRNRTMLLSPSERAKYRKQLLRLDSPSTVDRISDSVICQDIFSAMEFLPPASVDLLVVDPPYNLTKKFNSNTFRRRALPDYEAWMDSWLSGLVHVMKRTASIYICGDWRNSGAIQSVAQKYFTVRNRITWEREKGRGAKANWKNTAEDIWFCTLSDDYHFDVNAVKLKRRVLAPYQTTTGEPKDWKRTSQGDFRVTSPSNMWTDISVPFWSMPENTEHPTQKPEKLLAKLILASSKPGDLVFDPFLGSGTTAVVAKKLNRRFCGVELDVKFACIARKRLELAGTNNAIQGFVDGVFWERNSAPEQKSDKPRK